MLSRPAPGATEVQVSSLLAKVVASARDAKLVPLGCNQPALELFPGKRLGRIAASIARDGGGLGYELPPGLRALRRQLARRSLDWGCTLSPDDFNTPATHPERGNMTFRSIVETMGGHDLNHLKQIEALAV